jgi:hypothetical protein
MENKFQLKPRPNVTKQKRALIFRMTGELAEYVDNMAKKHKTKKTEIVRQMVQFAYDNRTKEPKEA